VIHATRVKNATTATNAKIVIKIVKIATKNVREMNAAATLPVTATNVKVVKIVVHAKLVKNVVIVSHVTVANALIVKTALLNANSEIVPAASD
jgi:hypothetical protein